MRTRSTPLTEGSHSDPPTATSHPGPLRRRQSRLSKRISSWSLSLGSSPSSHDQPTSQPFTFTAGSEEAVSIAHSSDPPLRNKLVKRSVSQHLPKGIGKEATITTYTLERPATRHSRLATLSGEWSRYAQSDHSSQPEVPSADVLSPYFASSGSPRDWDQSLLYDMDSQGDSKAIRRILPSAAPLPVMCPSTRIKAGTVGIDASRDKTNGPFGFGSRPSTSGMRFFFSSPVPELHADQLDSKVNRRRSTSVENVLAMSPAINERGKKFKIRLRGRRIVSAPASTMKEQASPSAEGHTSKRRHVDHAFTHTNGTLGSSSPLVNREPSPTVDPGVAQSVEPMAPPSPSLQTPPSNISLTSGSRRSHSAAYSMNSSRPGSDSDGKVFSSADEDEMRSDTAYDSVRTGMTKSSTGYQGPALETLFDRDSPPAPNSEHGSPFQFLGNMGSPTLQATKGPTPLEEDSSTSTPGRTITQDRRESHENDRSTSVQPSPASTSKALNLGQLSWDSDAERDSVGWPDSIEEEELDVYDDPSETPSTSKRTTNIEDPLASVRRKLNFLNIDQPHEQSESRANLFDWAEPTIIDRGLSDSPPPRPKTVHGKKNADVNGSRAEPRRAPSGLHTRSQSVPALAEFVGQRSAMPGKFGTWGIGSKGVTEDWNEDFDFDDDFAADAPDSSDSSMHQLELRAPIIVPETIKAQQTNVLANIGLVKEWGMLIEELKELRIKATSLGVDTAEHAEVFDNVDAMIELADQEAETGKSPNHPTPNSSPGFDFDEDIRPSPSLVSNELTARTLAEDVEASSPARTPLRHSFASQTSTSSDQTTVTRRPRKNSEAVAQSVIQALQSRRHDTPLATPDRKKKIPFDTRTLRKIVPYVSTLVKSVKQIVREAEGLNSSPKSSRRSPNVAIRGVLFAPPTADDENGWGDDD